MSHLPPHPLPQLIPQRLAGLLQRIKTRVWTVESTPLPIACTRSFAKHNVFDAAIQEPFTPIESFPFDWGKQFEQRWFRIGIPSTPDEADRYLFWKAGGESTLYVNGFPFYGIDVAHHYAPLPHGINEVYLESLCLESGIWGAGRPFTGISKETGARVHGAYLARRDEAHWKAENDLEVLMDILTEDYRLHNADKKPFSTLYGPVHPLDKAPPRFRRVLRQLDIAANVYESEGVSPFLEHTEAIYTALRKGNSGFKTIHTGHAHIDLVWMWPEQTGVSKAIHSFATANRLLEMYPEMRFGYSQPASYEAVGKRCPALLDAVRRKVESAQWEMTGGAYVESDTNMPCGEALLRGLLIGQDMFRELRGDESTTFWLPDVFGYSTCVPQLMNAAGIRYFYTTKLTWSAVTTFPYNSFQWRSPDGSSVLAHISAGHGYNEAVDLHVLRTAEMTYRQSDIHDEVLVPTGYGDGGGGVTEKMCERIRRLQTIEGMPSAEWGRIEDFFDRLEPKRHQLPVYEGELYLEYHRGVLTTHGDLKAAYRALERSLQTLEAARAVRGSGPAKLDYWKRLVFAQFHDYLPGSSVHEVYNEGIPELVSLAAQALEEAQEILTTSDAAALFNSLPIERRIWQEGRDGPFRAVLPPLAGLPVNDLQTTAQESRDAVRIEGLALVNDRLQAVFNQQGEITSLTIDGTTLPVAAPLGQLVYFPDLPHAFDAWEIDRPMLDAGNRMEQRATVESTQPGPHTASLTFFKQIAPRSHAVITYRLHAESAVLEIHYAIDWRDPDTLLRVAFPTAYSGRSARYGTPFGSITRSQKQETNREQAQWEVPASRWACVSDDGEREGLFVVTEAKYGFSCRDGELTASLIKSAKVTEGGNAPIRPFETDVLHSDLFSHEINLAIGKYSCTSPRSEQPAALADTLFTPLLSYRGSAIASSFHGLEGGESLQVAWVLPINDGSLLLRLHETLGQRGSCRLRFDGTASVTDARGTKMLDALNDGQLPFKPYELITVRICR